ncbi:hypothetical protein FDI14_gp048 [Mycobacterium phage SirDuracell]|uniref:Uncharacterized protein n=1 Tax=Mycobacterium phage SirDuracell TaxID=1034116 RepID=G1D5R3_9CAUD|nr:hypothetical protein FDI14_gp048 [Mycobacterium phage SirDuracell]AEK10113.1 hypothetical protein PBI_SIRDURACELL_48 [Mycobacterium phage SirDuracell]
MTVIYNDIYELVRLREMHREIQRSGLTLEEVEKLIEEGAELTSWLSAEWQWKHKVETWLQAERQWKIRAELLATGWYVQAEKGWRAMRDLSPNLDGVPRFELLSPVVQDRYAEFARAVMES